MTAAKATALAILAALAVTSCGWSPKRGEVLDTWHEPMHITVIPICGKYGCRSSVHVWPEAWHLKIRSDDPNDGDRYGKAGWRDVSEHVYGRCWAGTHYPDCAGAA